MKSKIGGLFKTVACAAAVSCAAFSFTSAAEAETLRVGTEATYAPFEFAADDGSLTGFDVELIRAIGKEAGYDDVQVINMPFDGLIPAIMTSQIDVIIAAMTITPERAERVDFTDPYYTSGLSVLIREDTASKYPNIDALKGQTLCAQIGSTGAFTAEKLSPGKVKAFNTEPEAFMELKAGGCEGVVNDRPINLYFLSQSNASDGVTEINEVLTAEKYGIAVRKGNTELLEKLNTGLKNARENGTYDQIYQKWFKLAPKD
ncbi:MAG: basic amino acid ABC transporter substrate-binding protein [Candidatus Anaerobiospirillum pullicola]|uniref:Basic amino acid ABC transporter substrate-binding protein n=1 Tax=Candidatus Anaerobiospirillum pullicola TaxID=2838451 RepID=A0A948TGL6_9GAMM|nr:basic amino acid ABC transporter substrate-binding protein [Candidatus Anaerobiospirillum pullicola]